ISKLQNPQPFIAYAFDVNIYFYSRSHTSNEKNLQKSAILLARKAMHIYKSTVIFLPILDYFCLFLPICESVANLHESTFLFAPNIHAYFCLFFIIWPVLVMKALEWASHDVSSKKANAEILV